MAGYDARGSGAFENPLEWLVQQMQVSSVHYEYHRSGRLIVSITFSGEAPLVRQLLDRMAELSEGNRPQPQTAEVLRQAHGSLANGSR